MENRLIYWIIFFSNIVSSFCDYNNGAYGVPLVGQEFSNNYQQNGQLSHSAGALNLGQSNQAGFRPVPNHLIVHGGNEQVIGSNGQIICNTNHHICTARYGELSRCGWSNICECYDTLSGGKKNTIQVDGRCYYKKEYNDYCQNNQYDYCYNSICINGRCSSSTRIFTGIGPFALISLLIGLYYSKILC